MDLYQCEVCGRQEGVNEMFAQLGVMVTCSCKDDARMKPVAKVLLPKGPKPLVMRVGG